MNMESFERRPNVDIHKLGEDLAYIAKQRHYPEIEILAQQTKASVSDLMKAFDVALDELRDKHNCNNGSEEYTNLHLAKDRMFDLRNGSLGPEIPSE